MGIDREEIQMSNESPSSNFKQRLRLRLRVRFKNMDSKP